MLTIRKDQIEKFQDQSFESFMNEMVVYFKKFAPRHAEVIGEEGIRTVIHLGLERTNRYEFTQLGPVRFYIELMFMFGSFFDTDFLLPWAGSSLKTDLQKNEIERADFIYDKMIYYVDNVSGPDNEYSLKALRKISQSVVKDYDITPENFDERAINALRDIHPQKCKYLGEELLSRLLIRGKQIANFHKITSVEGIMLMIALIFAIGHGFEEDPLFPWISDTLHDESIIDPNKKAERLERKVRIYLDKALIYLEKINT